MSSQEKKGTLTNNGVRHLTDQSDRTDPSDPPDQPDQTASTPKRLRPSGGYRQLRSFQTATIIYDATVSFCNRFVDRRSRTVDQMTQAARSGKQNIAEGSRAAATSSQTELRLVNVARASLDELLLDYEDFLRQRGLPQWEKDDPRAREVRRVGKTHPGEQAIAGAYSLWLGHADPAVVANTVICLIHQANYLLDQQIGGLERQFIHEGGYSERLAAARIEERQRRHGAGRPDKTDKQVLACPRCGKVMALRTIRKGERAGSQFWGCSNYPECRGTRPLDGADRSVRSDRSV